MSVIDEVTKSDVLVSLIQKENYIGRIYSVDYENALVVTTDFHKKKVLGIPQNAFLLATSINPDSYTGTAEFDKEIILLRVIGSCKLPQDDDNIRTKLDIIQNATAVYAEKTIDKLTANQIALCGLECRVLGTFYMKNQSLQLGSDIENFSSSLTQQVYIPKGEALEIIVNYVDPIRLNNSKEDFKKLGITGDVLPFKIGTVRYTSADRLQRKEGEKQVPVTIQPSDFLSRRTAVLGMTRTGKSNMVKQTVSVVKEVSKKSKLPIGQLIFDINGEYANANQQDKGAISDIFKDDCIRYRMIKANETDGFKLLKYNFYKQISEGFSIIKDLLTEKNKTPAQDLDTFLGISFEEPDKEENRGEYNRWLLKVALYKCILYKAGYEDTNNEKVYFIANDNIESQVGEVKKSGMTLQEATDWFIKAREKNKQNPLKSSSGKNWFNDEANSMLNLLANKNDKDSYINGYKKLVVAKEYHTSETKTNIYSDIYSYLQKGKIVILDLSVGIATMREKISKDLAKYIFNESMQIFTNDDKPPIIMIYIEEAHNLIGKKMELTETWPRLAKEGAKYKIGLVYATQEVSSVHPNILSNTENWFVTHINNESEVKELGKFYDFSDFSKSLLRAQDVGFARVKTLSSSFVVPVQIDKFDPAKWSK